MTPTLKLTLAAACAAALAAAPGAFAQSSQAGKSASGSQAQQSKSEKLAKQDREAIRTLAEVNMAEVKAGEMAKDKAESEKVKKFAEHMVEDHGKALERVKDVADAKDVEVPDEPSRKHQAAAKKLEKLDGAEFDRQYMAQMVKDHEEALKQARRAAKEAKDPEVKAAAEQQAKSIQQHLDQAKSLHASIAGASRGASAERGKAERSREKQK